MNILFINPHKSDFVYESVSYNLINRKSLKKYNFLNSFFLQNNTDFLFTSSSFKTFLNKLHLNFLDPLFLFFEKNIFLNLNPNCNTFEFIKSKNVKVKKYDIIFCFGFSIRDLSYDEVSTFSENCKNLIIHLSHYHLFANKLRSWSKITNLTFCADVDIREFYFYKFFIESTPKFFVLSFCLNPKFKNLSINRECKVISTGTFHEFEKIFSKKEILNDQISSIFGYLTLHIERRILFKFKDKLTNLVTLNSSMGTFNLKNIFRIKSNINQANYFSYDIVTIYNSYNFAFVGEDVAGLPGIGILEAIACGCIPIVNIDCYLGTPLENSTSIIKYNNINDLINIVENINNYKHLIKDTDNHKNLIQNVTNFYSENYQLSVLNNYLNAHL
jgi:hypothetical protein